MHEESVTKGKTHALVLAFLGLAVAAGWLITEQIRAPDPDLAGTGVVDGPDTILPDDVV